MPDAVAFIGHESIGWLPISAFVVAALALALFVLTRSMVWGNWLYALGGNPEAARRTGIPVRGVLVSVYVLSGLTAGIGAVILAGRTNAGSPLFGNLLELDTIAAVIIGGASFLGGRGHLGHALVGALMIGVIRNALNLLNVGIFLQLIVIGVVIVIAVRGRCAAQPSRGAVPRAPGGEDAMNVAHSPREQNGRSRTCRHRRDQTLRLYPGSRRCQPRSSAGGNPGLAGR